MGDTNHNRGQQMITYIQRWTHPTTAEVYSTLDHDHCDRCEAWATGVNAWWIDPNTVQGKEQLDAIGAHVLATYPEKAYL